MTATAVFVTLLVIMILLTLDIAILNYVLKRVARHLKNIAKSVQEIKTELENW